MFKEINLRYDYVYSGRCFDIGFQKIYTFFFGFVFFNNFFQEGKGSDFVDQIIISQKVMKMYSDG